MAKQPQRKQKLKVPVVFRGVSVTDDERIGVSILASAIEAGDVHHFFCGARLKVKLTVDPNASRDVEGQETFDGMAPEPIEATADAKSYSANPKKYSTTLVLSKEEASPSDLSMFAMAAGTIECERIGDAVKRNGHGNREDDEDEGEGGDEE